MIHYLLCVEMFFFFFKQKTAYEMRISDWSSDVCSSDLATLKAKGVKMLGGVEYLGVDDDGLRVRVDGSEQMLAVDHVVVCAGQESRRDLLAPLQAASVRIQVIGGADVAAELDAKRAIAQAARVAAAL